VALVNTSSTVAAVGGAPLLPCLPVTQSPAGDRYRPSSSSPAVPGSSVHTSSTDCSSRGDLVVCVDDLSTGRAGNVAHLDGDPSFRLVVDDVTTPGLGERLVAHRTAIGRDTFDSVVHLASPASPPAYLARPIETLEVGSTGTRQLLDVAVTDGARFLLASTSEVYGDPLEHPQSEGYHGNVNPTGPRSCYDEAKRYAEAITVAYARVHGLETRIARIFNTYGPRMRPDDGRVVTNFIHQAIVGAPLSDLRRRHADPQLLPRRRRGRRAARAARRGRTRSGQHRQPTRDHGARVRRARPRARRVDRRRSSTTICPTTTRRSAAPTSPWRASASAGSRRSG
jgi:hypothetical protein